MLTFTPISQYKQGALSGIISKSYSELVTKYPKYWKKEKEKWNSFDKNAFDNPSIGKCIFVTCFDNKPVGLASWDPRDWPEYGEIGQNCILPEFRDRGFGIKQMQEVLRIFRENGVKKAKVITSSHPFFKAAQKMYKLLGFKEVRKIAGGPDPSYKLIEFRMEL